jgi:hypothetical protein
MTQSPKTSAGDARSKPTPSPARHEAPTHGLSEADPRTAPQHAEKDPADWTTGQESMTGPQASYLQTLCQEAGEEFDPGLTKAEASQRIDALQALTGRGRDH